MGSRAFAPLSAPLFSRARRARRLALPLAFRRLGSRWLVRGQVSRAIDISSISPRSRLEPGERGGQDVWRDYLTWGQERLAESQRALAQHGRRNAVRIRSLYRPATTPVDQSTVTGP